MRALCILAAAIPLLAQEQAKAPPAATPAPAPATSQSAAPASDSSAQILPGEARVTGYIDLGYRWQTGVGGSFDTYRSIVNLGSGPKLLGADFTIVNPRHHLFDSIHVRAYSWGDEPYETLHVDVEKLKLYNFNADYREFAYFNYLPSYANPLLSSNGIILNEQSFDTRRRIGTFSLDLFPQYWIVPYVAYDHDGGSGTGATVFVSDGNEYPVPYTTFDRTELFRGGFRIGLKRFHATLETGGNTFGSNQQLYQNTGQTNYGNNSMPYFGQTLSLNSLIASYGIGGTSVYGKALFTANVASWLDFYGQFLYSEPKTNVNYSQYDNGNLVQQSTLLFYTSQQYLVASASAFPHATASVGAEIRPFRRLRLVENWMTDRFHEAGASASNQLLSGKSASSQMTALLVSSLFANYNQNEVDAFFEFSPRFVIHGGYRYVWGDANNVVLPPSGLPTYDRGNLRRNVGIGGITYRASQKLSLTGEVEGASSGGVYFRTSLYDYQRVRAQARYQLKDSLSFTADFSLLNNQNPLPGVNYDYLAHQESLSLMWSPRGGKNWTIQGSYSRSSIYSNIGYLEPETLTPNQSLYRDNAHAATALITGNLKQRFGITPRVTAGGSLFISSGSRPTDYFQPFAKIMFPVYKHVEWFGEWSYYGYGEAFYLYEGFRSHLVTTGVRFTR
jgi:hypothetical protein